MHSCPADDVPRPSRALVRFLAAGLLCVAAQAEGVADGRAVPGEEIRRLIVGNTLVGPYFGWLYYFSYAADGGIVGNTWYGPDRGRWRIRDGDVFCHHWTTTFGGDERCYRWYDAGGGRYRLENVDAFRTRDLNVWRIDAGTGG